MKSNQIKPCVRSRAVASRAVASRAVTSRAVASRAVTSRAVATHRPSFPNRSPHLPFPPLSAPFSASLDLPPHARNLSSFRPSPDHASLLLAREDEGPTPFSFLFRPASSLATLDCALIAGKISPDAALEMARLDPPKEFLSSSSPASPRCGRTSTVSRPRTRILGFTVGRLMVQVCRGSRPSREQTCNIRSGGEST